MTGLWVLCSVLFIMVILLGIKVILLKKSAKEISSAFLDRLTTDTNTLIDISSNDKDMRKLAAEINSQLRLLRKEHLRYVQGDKELKDAITNISHDLRTPLTAVCGYLYLLEQQDTSEDVKRYLYMIQNRTEVMKQLTEELFQYSVISSQNNEIKEKVDINRILEECLASFYGAMKEKGIEPSVEIPTVRVTRKLDTMSLTRIFGNIMGNALKYSDGDLSVMLKEDGTIIFSNTARKLSSVTVGKLFDRFYTVESGEGSTGLGLSIARLLTERMNGTIEADYRENKLYITVKFPQQSVR